MWPIFSRRTSLLNPALLASASLAFAFVPYAARACPAFVDAGLLPPAWRADIGKLTFFAQRPEFGTIAAERPKTDKGKQEVAWNQLPFQLDPQDKAGRLVLVDAAASHSQENAVAGDRLSFPASEFGARKADFASLPCGAERALELTLRGGPGAAREFGYLVRCPGPALQPRVAYQASGNLLRSAGYEYFFDQDNHMLFDSIYLSPSSGGAKSLVAADSDLLIKADVKYFFNMVFKPSDVNSILERHRLGPLAAVGSLNFYLKILFFKVRLALTTDVSFFEDAVYIPMTVHLPSGAQDRLHAGSGIIYSWRNLLPGPDSIGMPAGGLGTFPDKEKVLRQYCRSGTCRFSLTFPFAGKALRMAFRVGDQLVRQGFFPMWVLDPSARAFDDFGLGRRPGEYFDRRVAIYFETSGLRDGNHGWDFWLSFGEADDDCPGRLRVQEVSAPVRSRR